MTSGTDIHNKVVLDDATTGMVFEKPLESINDYVAAIKSGKGFTPLIAPERRGPIESATMHLPTYLYDEKNEGHLVTKEDLFPNK